MELSHFLHFITLFIINIGCATYLVFAYNRTRIVLLNALAFFVLAIRCCTEFYLPQVADFETASEIVRWHSYVVIVFAVILGSAWWHVRPFKNHPKEKQINNGFALFLTLAYSILFVLLYLRIPFKLHPEKIDGYWQYYLDFSTYWSYYFHAFHLLLSAIVMTTFVISIIRERSQRLLKGLFLLIYSLVPIGLAHRLLFATATDYAIPSGALAYTVISIIASRIFTNSRLFRDNSIDIISDTFNSISDLVIFTTSDFKIRQYNEQAEEVFHFDENNASWTGFLADNSQFLEQDVSVFLNDLVANGDKKQELELIVNGKKMLFLVSVSPYLKSGHLFGYTFFLQDITEERSKEQQLAVQNEELKNLNDVKDRIFTIIGHDLRKPALAFRGITKKVNYLLKKQDYTTLNDLGDNIEQEAFALSKLTDNLLNWALTQKNTIPHHPQNIKIAPIIEEILSIFKHTIETKSINIIADIPNTLHLFADRNAVNTIIRNLMDNAIKYTPEGGQIWVHASEEKRGLRITIADTGVGIPEDQLKDIFLLKRDKSQEGTAGEKGTGLGLHLIHELTLLNEGKIEIESELGKGSRFSVILPSPPLRLVS